MKDPVSGNEWQEAVDAAKGALTLVSARAYGLVEGGPSVNIARCQSVLAQGRVRGITPRGDAVERFVFSLMETGRF